MASGWGVGGRPVVVVRRRLDDYPPPNPQPTPCLLWQGGVDRDGYGLYNPQLYKTGSIRRFRIHRWVWEQANGPIPDGLVVRHRCDNRPCFRLSHLELGTVAENNADAQERHHLGPPPKLSEADMERLLAERAAGRTYRQIWDDWPEVRQKVAFTTLRTAVWKGVKGWNRPEGYVPHPHAAEYHQAKALQRTEATRPYEGWRENRP